MNVTSLFKREESEKDKLRFEPSRKSGLPVEELCSALSAEPCPDYRMRPYPGVLVQLESQFTGAPAFAFGPVFYLDLYPDEALSLLSDRENLLPMSAQVERLKLAEWIGS